MRGERGGGGGRERGVGGYRANRGVNLYTPFGFLWAVKGGRRWDVGERGRRYGKGGFDVIKDIEIRWK